MDEKIEFKDRVRKARKEAGLTQQKMADLMTIPKRTIENWEGGKSLPPGYVEDLVIEKLLSIAQDRR